MTKCGSDYLASITMLTNMPELQDFLTDRRPAWLGRIIRQQDDQLLQESLAVNRKRRGNYWEQIEKDLKKIGLVNWGEVVAAAPDKEAWGPLLLEFRERMLPWHWIDKQLEEQFGKDWKKKINQPKAEP